MYILKTEILDRKRFVEDDKVSKSGVLLSALFHRFF